MKAQALNRVSKIPSPDHTPLLPLGGWCCHLAHRCLKPFYFRLQLIKNQVIPDFAIDCKSSSPWPRSVPPHPWPYLTLWSPPVSTLNINSSPHLALFCVLLIATWISNGFFVRWHNFSHRPSLLLFFGHCEAKDSTQKQLTSCMLTLYHCKFSRLQSLLVELFQLEATLGEVWRSSTLLATVVFIHLRS